MISYMFGSDSYQTHEFCHIKGIVSELGMCTKGRVMALSTKRKYSVLTFDIKLVFHLELNIFLRKPCKVQK